MWPEDIAHVLRQFSLVMRPGGLCINTWLMVDDFARYILKCDLADRKLPHRVRDALTYSLDNPLTCAAYEETTVRGIYRDAGHEIIDLLPGSWSGRDNGVHYQDIVISRPIAGQ